MNASIHSLASLTADVLSLLGEETAPEAVARKIRALLPGAASTLIADASATELAGAPELTLTPAFTRMPSGGYAAEADLPAGFLRLAGVRMSCWREDAREVVMQGSGRLSRLWNPEPGIAGSPERPIAYVTAGASGLKLFAMAAPSAGEATLSLRLWSIPLPDSEGNFHFPAPLRHKLAANIAAQLA